MGPMFEGQGSKPLKIGLLVRPEISLKSYHYTLSNVPHECRYQILEIYKFGTSSTLQIFFLPAVSIVAFQYRGFKTQANFTAPGLQAVHNFRDIYQSPCLLLHSNYITLPIVPSAIHLSQLDPVNIFSYHFFKSLSI